MSTLRSAERLSGFRIRALDGILGKVHDFYFDDSTWAVRHLVADIGKWFLRRNILVSPELLKKPEEGARIIPVAATMEQIRRSPNPDADRPIVLQYEASLRRRYGWKFYWGAEEFADRLGEAPSSPEEAVNEGGKAYDPHLRSAKEVTGYRIHALDGMEGRIDDFLIDDESWGIRFMVARLDNKKRVAFPSDWTRRISFEESRIYLKRTMDDLRSSPPAGPLAGTTRRYVPTGTGA